MEVERGEQHMEPQTVEGKTVSKQIKHQDLRVATGSMLMAVVLIGEFSLGSVAAAPGLWVGSELIYTSGVVSLQDQGLTPHQSDPDCKYPPCD